MPQDPYLSVLIKAIDQLVELPVSWLTDKKLVQIKGILTDQQPAELRNRKSKVHLSASAMVFSKNAGFFIRHPYLRTTLLPAGHVEPGELPINCAVREFHEETGYQVKPESGQLIDVNLIAIPANPVKGESAHQHVDFRFHFLIEPGTRSNPELPVSLLTQAQAPTEFAKYFALIKSGD
ncbi:putative DHNTP pyrophosphohydrolase [Lactobacillus helveticus]|uniref:NUDIX domain-containing protein n=1 Tax=Lactobacillus helveticus TaxID=1587 RepID=UPI001561F8E6|nr:NUDIX domain-containing protein [Lactobacillus helveticus]NRO64064.1 putative DHNTP pyrophosphohydrolase [Lactobacillus helveticus]